MRVLVTGAAGLVGFETLDQLRACAGVQAVGTSRTRSAQAHDLVAWDMEHEPPLALRGRWDAIVHAAADTRWTLTPTQAERANVATVRALDPLVSNDTHVIHISTAFATGLRNSTTSTRIEDYRNTYEWSKAYAERVAHEIFPRLTIVRPPLVMGRRGDGRAARFSGLYTVLRGLTSSMVPAIVARPNAFFEVIPVDDLAGLVIEAASANEPSNAVLTIAGGEDALRVGDAVALLSRSLNAWRRRRGCEEFPTPRLLSPESWGRFFMPFAVEHLPPRHVRVLELLSRFHPYLAVEEPICPTHAVRDIEPCIAASVHHWAEKHQRLASQPLKPWKAVA